MRSPTPPPPEPPAPHQRGPALAQPRMPLALFRVSIGSLHAAPPLGRRWVARARGPDCGWGQQDAGQPRRAARACLIGGYLKLSACKEHACASAKLVRHRAGCQLLLTLRWETAVRGRTPHARRRRGAGPQQKLARRSLVRAGRMWGAWHGSTAGLASCTQGSPPPPPGWAFRSCQSAVVRRAARAAKYVAAAAPCSHNASFV